MASGSSCTIRCAEAIWKQRSAVRYSSIRKESVSVADQLGVEEIHGLGIATVMARKGATGAAIGAALGIVPPEGPHMATANALTMIGTGPQSWLVVKERAVPD